VTSNARYLVLLRGVNVGGKNKVPMSELRSLVESLGHTDVVTLIQSGNIVFNASKAVTPRSLEAAIKKQFKLDVAVIVLTTAQLKKIIAANPFKREDTATLHFGFMVKKPDAAAVKKLDGERFLPDAFAFRGPVLYVHLRNGLGRSKLLPYLDRQLEIPTTVRNWNTVNKLVELG